MQEVQIRREAERGLGDTSEKLTGELSTAVKLLEAERSELSQVRTKLATLEKSEQALLNEKATFTEAQRRDQVSYTELQKRLEAVEKLYEEEQDKRSRAQDKLATLEKSHEALLKEKARLGEAESGHLALHTHLRENLVAVEKLRQEEQTRREQVQEKLATLEGSQRTLLAEQAKNLESQKQQAERQAQQSLASANADLEARLATAAAEVTELKGKQADWTALQTQASDDQKAIRSLHKVIEIATSTYENLQRELDAKGEACTQLQEQLQTKASEEDRLHQELDKQHADYTDLQKELADKTLKYEADMEQKDFCIQELQAKVQDRNESLGELLKGMKAQRRQTNAMNPAYQSDTGSMEDDYSLPRTHISSSPSYMRPRSSSMELGGSRASKRLRSTFESP